jgi:nicotinamidase/pyrazinamidase
MNALILVDIQNDFMPGVALAKWDGRDVVPVDNGHRRATGLTDYPREQSVTGAGVYGVATGICVKSTCLDARSGGGETSIIVDACRGVELQIGDITAAVDEMQSVCVNVIRGIEL